MTIINEADATTGWTGGSVAALSGFEREATACLGDNVGEGYLDTYLSVTSADRSATTYFAWLRSGNPHTEANNGFGIILGDGTDRIAYSVGGSDNYGHFVLGWSNFKLDTAFKAATPGDFRTLAGAEGSLTFTAITQVGVSIGYVSKANGNSENVFFDIIRRIANGSAALTIGGGTTGARGTFAEIVAADVSTANQTAYGIFRTLVPGSKSYEMFYGCDWGDSGTATTYFEDTDFQLYIVGTDMSTGNMDVNILGNSTGTNHFRINNYTIVGVDTRSNWDLSGANIDLLDIENGTFTGLGTFTFATTVDANNVIWDNCLQINDSGVAVNLSGGSVLNSAVAADDGAVLWNNATDPDGFLDDMTFSKGTNAHHAIEFGLTAPTTITLVNQTYTGFNASNGQNDSTINILRTTGTVTINVQGGDTPSYKTAGATVVVQNTVTVAVNVKAANDASNIQSARVLLLAGATGTLPSEDSVTITRSGSTASVSHTGHGLSDGDKVLIAGADQEEYNGVKTITNTSTDAYDFTVSGTPTTPATGTIEATAVILDGDTDVNGDISDTGFNFVSNQDVTGRVRKGTSSPYYKTAAIAGTITNAGFSTTVFMVSDE